LPTNWLAPDNPMRLEWPASEHLASYVDALNRGWSPDNVRGDLTRREELQRIATDPVGFLAGLVDRSAKGLPIRLPDGTSVPRLPGYRRWMWDGEFCGSIGFRWQPGTEELPPWVLGHIGYTVVPWKEGRGYATLALQMLLDEARAEGLRWVVLTTEPHNLASRRVIEKNGGVLEAEFMAPAMYGRKRAMRYRIEL
jgi:predicted acetyltransferase